MQSDIPQFVEPAEESVAGFPPSSWKYVLTLLGLIIVADKKTFQEEIDTFLEAAVELRAIIDPKLCFTKKMAHDWFKLNKPALEAIIDGPSHDTAICEILTPIKHMPFKLDVISCMVRIAVSDGKYCDVERGLIAKTCLYWKVRSNFQHNLEHIHKPDDTSKLATYLKDLPKYGHIIKTYAGT